MRKHSKNIIRVFLDSNVILSGLFSSKGSPRLILDLLSLKVPGIQGVTGQYNLEEIERNLKTRFPQILALYREFFPKMNLKLMKIPPESEVAPLISQMSSKDAPVLASARLAKADYLMTGDKKGFPRDVVSPIRVISPREFIDRVLPQIVEGN